MNDLLRNNQYLYTNMKMAKLFVVKFLVFPAILFYIFASYSVVYSGCFLLDNFFFYSIRQCATKMIS